MARRSIAARHLWHQVGDYLEHALRGGASFDEAIAVLRDRASQLEATAGAIPPVTNPSTKENENDQLQQI